MSDYLAIAVALAARYGPGTLPTPAGYDPVRLATHLLPEAMPPLPCVLVFAPAELEFTSGNGTRQQGQDWVVRFYYDQAGDLARQSAAMLAWLGSFVDALKLSAQLGGLVTSARLMKAKVGFITYGGLDYAGIEGTVRIVTDESWPAVA